MAPFRPPGPPLRHLPHTVVREVDQLIALTQPTAAMHGVEKEVTDGPFPGAMLGRLPLGSLSLLSFSGGGLRFSVEEPDAIHLVVSLGGERRIRMAGGEAISRGGGVMLLPQGRRDAGGSHSAAIFRLDPARLAAVAATMAAAEPQPVAAPGPCWWHGQRPLSARDGRHAAALRGLLRHIDALLAVDPSLPTLLALDDVVLRHAALMLHPGLLGPEAGDRRRTPVEGRRAFEELLDHIRANLDQPLPLSALEAHCHYSTRALQLAFQRAFQCSPTQWIREQRLSRALQKLQAGEPGLTVRAVALACGYRHQSHFSRDFQQRFGLPPSRVRRPGL